MTFAEPDPSVDPLQELVARWAPDTPPLESPDGDAAPIGMVDPAARAGLDALADLGGPSLPAAARARAEHLARGPADGAGADDPVAFDRATAFAAPGAAPSAAPTVAPTFAPTGAPTFGADDEVVGDGDVLVDPVGDSMTIDDGSTLVVTDAPPADPGAGAIDDPTPPAAPVDDVVAGDGNLVFGTTDDPSTTIDDGSTVVVTDPPPADPGAGAMDAPAPIGSPDDVVVGDGNSLFDPPPDDGSMTIADPGPIAPADDVVVGDGNVLFDPPVDDGSTTIDLGPDENSSYGASAPADDPIDYGGFAGHDDDLDVR